MSEAKKYFDTRKVDEKTQEKAKGVLKVPTIQKLLSRIRGGPVGPVEVTETEARAFLKWLKIYPKSYQLLKKLMLEIS